MGGRLAIAGLMMPALFAWSVRDFGTAFRVQEISVGVAVVLLLAYIAYLIFSTRPEGQIAVGAEMHPAPIEGERAPWRPRIALAVLIGSTLGTAVLAEALVGTVESVSHTLGFSAFFVGIIVVPLIGNVAEHISAAQLAAKGKVDIGIAIALGSSTRVALFVVPVFVFAGLLLGHPMDFIFHPLEILIVTMSAGLVAFICIDGESNWFEAIQLLALYILAGIIFFFLPLH